MLSRVSGFTPYGKQYACSIEQELEELHLAEGLR
jgi:hypothetical protein